MAVEKSNPNNQKIANVLIKKMAFRLTIVILTLAVLSYFYIKHTKTNQYLNSLQEYSYAKAEREKVIFEQAKQDLLLLKNDLLNEFKNPYNFTRIDEFKRYFVLNPDGAIRTKIEYLKNKKAGLFIKKNTSVTREIKVNNVVGFDLVSQYGSAWQSRYTSVWLILENSGVITYAQNNPAFTYSVDPNFDDRIQDYYLISKVNQNPLRKGVWTNTYFDSNINEWMISYVMPIDIDGKHMGSVGIDLSIDQILQRVLTQKMQMSDHFLVTIEGNLIAHPSYMDEIKKSNGSFHLNEIPDKAYSDLLKHFDKKETLIQSQEINSYVSIIPIIEPNWYYLSIYPIKDIHKAAVSAGETIVIITILALFLEIALLYSLLIQNISSPLRRLTLSTKKIAEGDYELSAKSTELMKRKDEIGILARSFYDMTRSLQERDLKLAQYAEQLKERVLQTEGEKDSAVRIADAAVEKAIDNAKMAALGQMASGISHEINNPLFVVLNCASQITKLVQKDQIDKEKILLNTSRIENMSVRISKIIKGLKSFSRNSAQDPFEIVSIKSILEVTLEFCHARFDSHGVQLHIPQISQTLLKCRETQISQVLLNLLNNSFDAIQNRQEKWIEIQFKEEAQFLKISVIDSGEKIDPKILDRIMEPFFTTKSVDQGTGLGLSIAKGIIEEHGGTLQYNALAPHTTFEFTVPIAYQ